MKLLVISLLCGSVVSSYPQQYFDENETGNIADQEEESKESRRAIFPENSGKILKAIKVIPNYSSNEEGVVVPDSSRYSSSSPIPIIRYDKSQSLDGSYKHSYETGNNIIAEETGFFKNAGDKDLESLVQQGSYKYTAPDGTIIITTYTADEGGFRVEGAHLPTSPPIPEEIQKSLEKIYESIRLQQEAEDKETKYNGKTRPGPIEDQVGNSVTDNYPLAQRYSQQ